MDKSKEAREKESCSSFQRLDQIERDAVFVMMQSIIKGDPPEDSIAAGNAYLIQNGRKPALKL